MIAAIPYHSVYFVGTCCLNHLVLTTHPDTALEKLDKMGRNHDEEVKKWRDQLAQFIFSPSSDRDGTLYCYTSSPHFIDYHIISLTEAVDYVRAPYYTCEGDNVD